MINIDYLLSQSMADKSYEDQVHWILQITHWLRRNVDPEGHRIAPERIYNVRLKHLLLILYRNPKWKSNFTSAVSSLIRKISSTHFFTDVGMSNRAGFLQDFIGRLEEKILPQSPLTDDLATLMYEIFHEEDFIAIDQIDEKVMEEFLGLFNNENELSQQLKDSLLASVLILSSHLLSATFSIFREVSLQKEKPASLGESTLYLEALSLLQHRDFSKVDNIESLLKTCEESRARIYELLQSQGVKIDVVYLLETQRRRIERIRQICAMLHPDKPNSIHVRAFISQLIVDLHHQRSLVSFFSENLSLLTQRIVQRNSHVGEHYVTFTKSEFRKMFRSALGGGGVTSITVLVKMLTSMLPIAGFIKGLVESLNYSASFVCIQVLGWTLATKQPSTTAPFLAQSFRRSISESRKAIIALLRTQFIAVIGNLTLVFPICFIISWTLWYLGHPLLSSEEAAQHFHSSSIFGASPLFAAFTGILLFLSSLIAGWFENWVIIHKLPNRILTNHTFYKVLGPRTAKKFSFFVAKNSNALAANISLGFLLGLLPQYLKFMGIPLEVKHVTLSTGSFATSIPIVMQQGINYVELFLSVIGLLTIGVLNISVSFSLALVLAAISSRVKFTLLLSLVRWGFLFILAKPWILLMPEKEPQHDIPPKK